MRHELLRKVVHVGLALFFLLLIQFNLLNIYILLLMLLGGFGVWIFRNSRIKLLAKFIEVVDRGALVYGKGVVTYMLGIIFVYFFFQNNKDILSAGIIVLGLGDGMAALIGTYFGRVKLPYNKKKTLEGLIFGMLFSVLGAVLFVPFFPALFTSIIVMLLETFEFKIFHMKIDDNLYIPVFSAFLLYLII